MGTLARFRDGFVAPVKVHIEAEAARTRRRFELAAPKTSDVGFVDELKRLLAWTDLNDSEALPSVIPDLAWPQRSRRRIDNTHPRRVLLTKKPPRHI
jgi:hypothetical protein